jgi:hypothetical protein
MKAFSQFPVVLIAFNRPHLTAQVFERIREWKPRELVLVVDGPRKDHPLDIDLVAQVRSIVRQVDWPCSVTEDFAEVNLGLKRRVSSGLSATFAANDAAIILEDDCVPDLSFFRFANELLEKYRDDSRVGLVSGSSRLRGKRASEYSYDFSNDVRIWGWATWARTWNRFVDSGDLDVTWDRQTQERLIEGFPSGPRRRAIASMMKSAAELDSWALPFAIHCRSNGYLSAVPESNLVENIGFGALSTHTTFEDYVSEVEAVSLDFPLRHPVTVSQNPLVDTLENLMDTRVRFLFPLAHPWDVAGRFVRYFMTRIHLSRAKV